MNQELRDMFVADQVERNNHPGNDTPEYRQLRERYTQEMPQSGIDKEKVPEWLQEALERWEREES